MVKLVQASTLGELLTEINALSEYTILSVNYFRDNSWYCAFVVCQTAEEETTEETEQTGGTTENTEQTGDNTGDNTGDTTGDGEPEGEPTPEEET